MKILGLSAGRKAYTTLFSTSISTSTRQAKNLRGQICPFGPERKIRKHSFRRFADRMIWTMVPCFFPEAQRRDTEGKVLKGDFRGLIQLFLGKSSAVFL
jgi:hypothetical protein